MIAPDDTTFDYIAKCDRPFVPRGRDLEAAIADWKTLKTEDLSAFDTHVQINASTLVPQVTWGTNPAMTVDVTGRVPDLAEIPAPVREEGAGLSTTWD